MTHREARRTLGSRVARRSGTKTKVIPGSASSKRPPKYRYFRARPITLAAKVARIVAKSRVAT